MVIRPSASPPAASSATEPRSDSRYRILIGLLIAAATLTIAILSGCSEGVLAPKGPIAGAEREILFNSLGIMLAIV
ncbi:MAG: hypothetical protein JOY64_26135, partial [Alphaproteobacteria bacterium]|nr:hypothetical protein [Alphaproteobacteria bacterium]